MYINFVRLPWFVLIVDLSNRIVFRSVQLHACSVRFSIMNWSPYRHDPLLFYCCISCNIIGRLSVENLGLWNFYRSVVTRKLVNITGKNKTDIKGRGLWHFNTVNNKYPPGVFSMLFSIYWKALKRGEQEKKESVACKHLYAWAFIRRGFFSGLFLF